MTVVGNDAFYDGVIFLPMSTGDVRVEVDSCNSVLGKQK